MDEASCINFHIAVLQHSGLWSVENEYKDWKYYAKTFFLCTEVAITLFLTTISLPMGIYTNWEKNPSVLAEQTAFLFYMVMVLLYVWCCKFRKSRFERTVRAMELVISRGKLYPGRPETILKDTRWMSEQTVGFLAGNLCAAASILIGFVPVLRASRTMHISGWYPYDIKASPMFEITLALLSYFGFSAALILAGVISFLLSLLVQGIGQIRLLNYNLKNIHEHSCHSIFPIHKPSRLVKGNLKVVSSSKKHFHKKLNANIRKCIRHHQAIMSFVKEVQSSFGPLLFYQIIDCTVPSALCIIHITHLSAIDIKTLLVISLVFIGMVNLFIFATLIELITHESSLVKEAIFGCQWLDASDGFKRSMRVVISSSNRPMVIRVAGFIPISLEQVVRVLHRSYSFYMSLRQITKHEHM